MEYATVMSGPRTVISLSDLPREMADDSAPVHHAIHVTEDGIDLRAIVSELEKNLILQSLELTGGNKARAAALLDLKRTTFVEKWKRIQRGDYTN
jgi:transcriptional regulator with PAS, ATPase and Fis domain